MRRFAPGAGVAAVLVAATATLIEAQAGGATWTNTVRYSGLAVAEIAALVSCALAAWRATGRRRWAWTLLAGAVAAALAGLLTDMVATAAGLGGEMAFPSADDVGVLAAVPFAIAGLLAFPPVPNLYAMRWRTALDGAVVVLSLTFIILAVGLPQAFVQVASSPTWWVGAAYPIADVALFSVIFVVLRRSISTQGRRLVLVVGGLAINAVSYNVAAFLLASGFSNLGYLFEGGPMFGYAMIALAPLWPEPQLRDEPADISLWQAMLPYAAVAAVAVTALVLWLDHRYTNEYVAWPAGGLLVILLGSQILSLVEARSVLGQSRQSERKLRQRERMLNDVIDHAPQGVAAITPDRRITNANPRLASMLYAPEKTILGGSTDSFLPEDYVSRVFRNLATAQADSDSYEADSQARRADGSQLWVHWSATPIRRPDGSIDYFMCTFEDVTAKREAEETAVANLAQMEKLNRLKTEFVSMVSHEFRTGLVGIMGFSELIHDQDLEVAEIKILAEELNGEAQRLNRMITDMLDFDRLEAGKVRLNLGPLDLNQLVQEAIDRAAMTTDKHMISANLQPNLPLVIADSDRLTQVLSNLMSNAVKYSPNGGEICVSTRSNTGSNEVSVRDNGKGIPPEFINRLFGRYERYEDKHAGKIIGTGLGLAITRQIVEMHGGRISVDSVVGKGSDFHFTIPLAAGPDVAATRSA